MQHRLTEQLDRRRPRGVLIGIGAAAVVAVALAVVLTVVLIGQDDEPEGDEAAYQRLGAWAQATDVHIGEHTAEVAGGITLGYTSVGVVVNGVEGQALVTPEGTVEPLDLDLAVDPALPLPAVATGVEDPYLAYVKTVDDETVQLVVRDLRNGEDQPVGEPAAPGEVSIPGNGWLWGDRLHYVDTREEEPEVTVDWRSGDRLENPDPTFANGVGVSVAEDGTWTVRSFDGEELLTVGTPDSSFTWASLSPDGRYLTLTDSEAETTVHDIEEGTSASVGAEPVIGAGEYGWTPDGHLLGHPYGDSLELQLCEPTTGRCRGIGVTTDRRPVTGPVVLVPGATASWR